MQCTCSQTFVCTPPSSLFILNPPLPPLLPSPPLFQAAIAGVKVSGLKGRNYLNKDPDPKNPIPGVEER